MRTIGLFALLATACGAPALAQPADPHAGHHMPAAPTQPAEPHAGHQMPMTSPQAGDHHAGHHTMEAAPAAGEGAAPPAPSDHAADRVYPPEQMAAARAQLAREHGDIRWSKVMIDSAEFRPTDKGDGYGWEARASFGGDINRALFKTKGDAAGHGLERAEVEALYSRAIGPYFNLNAGLRQDFEPRPRRTYAALGVEGFAPYWLDVDASLFISREGELSARLEGAYDLRLTQKLILQPRAELNLRAQDAPELRQDSGLTKAELGLRLRYEVVPEFAPYVGVNYERSFGGTADFARAAGEDMEDARLVFGLRTWF